LTAPRISERTTFPLAFTSRFTLSTTSRNTSFFRYRIPSDRHETAFVTAIGGRGAASSLCDSCVIYLRRAVSRLSAPTGMAKKGRNALLEDLRLGRLRVADVG
jgi:hypothetical protein